jgi:hypothetical protein
MDAGKISSSPKSVKPRRSGINTIPPPAPNKPLIHPAPMPAKAIFILDTNKKSPPVKIIPQEAFLIRLQGN